nr:hypothetical protein [Paenibacillus larvae]
MQALTVKIRILDQPAILRQLGNEYIRVVNQLTKRAEQLGGISEMTTKDVETVLPSAVCNQAIRDAKKCFLVKSRNLVFVQFLKICISLINQNYTVSEIQLRFLSL